MRLLGLVIRRLSHISARIGGFFHELTQLLNSLLPAILPTTELTKLIQGYYENGYRGAGKYYPTEVQGTGLAVWEETVLTQYNISSGTVLVLGAGVGRESIEFARRGLLVIGLDISQEALQLAVRTTQEQHIKALFIQGSFYQIPTILGCVDLIFLSGIMYSAIPGCRLRQEWLKKLSLYLKEGGLAVLSFYINRAEESQLAKHIRLFNSWLSRLPGANPSYQPGDFVAHDHFLHAFLDEKELRTELAETGATTVQINWDEQFAVLAWRG